jgi:hypothetical protein
MNQVVNHFFHRGRPIHDPSYFFGRQGETQVALGLLGNAQSISVVGPRRIGKTSFLYHLADPDIASVHVLSPKNHLFLYLDATLYSTLDPTELYRNLWTELVELALQPVQLERPPPTDRFSFQDFRGNIERLYQQGIKLIILLDEFEALSRNPNLDANFFSELRGLAMQYEVTYITASVSPLLNLTYSQSSVLNSAFFNIFAPVRLGLFDLAEAEALLLRLAERGGIPFSSELVAFLLELAGPHPLLLQIAGYYAFQTLLDTADPGSPTHSLKPVVQANVRRNFVADAASHWRYTWDRLSEAEQRLLALLPLAQQIDPVGLRRLEETCLVRISSYVTGQRTEILPLSPAFRDFVNTQAVSGLLQVPPVTLDPEQRLVLLRGAPIHLPPTEFRLLHCLLEHSGQVASYQTLSETIWPDDEMYEPDIERLKTSVKTLRRVLGADKGCIQNVPRRGYRFATAA